MNQPKKKKHKLLKHKSTETQKIHNHRRYLFEPFEIDEQHEVEVQEAVVFAGSCWGDGGHRRAQPPAGPGAPPCPRAPRHPRTQLKGPKTPWTTPTEGDINPPLLSRSVRRFGFTLNTFGPLYVSAYLLIFTCIAL